MGCNASNHPPHNNPGVRSTSYSIFRRCRRRKKNKDEQNDEYNDEELKRKIDMVSGGAGGDGDESNKDISLSHHGFNFLGNSFGKKFFKSASSSASSTVSDGGAAGSSSLCSNSDTKSARFASADGKFDHNGAGDDSFQDGEQDDLNNKNNRGNGGSGIFVNVPLLAQS